MHYADRIGIPEIIAPIEHYAQEDAHYWQMPTLLRRMQQDGRSFADLNGE